MIERTAFSLLHYALATAEAGLSSISLTLFGLYGRHVLIEIR
jgi:hypothetical protein